MNLHMCVCVCVCGYWDNMQALKFRNLVGIFEFWQNQDTKKQITSFETSKVKTKVSTSVQGCEKSSDQTHQRLHINTPASRHRRSFSLLSLALSCTLNLTHSFTHTHTHTHRKFSFFDFRLNFSAPPSCNLTTKSTACLCACTSTNVTHGKFGIRFERMRTALSKRSPERKGEEEYQDCTYSHLCRWRLGWRSIVEDPKVPFEEALLFHHLHVAVNRDSGYVLPVLIGMMWLQALMIFPRAPTFTPCTECAAKL
jgi:hypothetical protein